MTTNRTEFVPIADNDAVLHAAINALLPPRCFIHRSELRLPLIEGEDTEGSEANFFSNFERFPFTDRDAILELAHPSGKRASLPSFRWCMECSGGWFWTSNGPCKKRDYFSLTVHAVSRKKRHEKKLWAAFKQPYGDSEETEPEWLTLEGAPIIFTDPDVAKSMALLCRPGVRPRCEGLGWRRCDADY